MYTERNFKRNILENGTLTMFRAWITETTRQ